MSESAVDTVTARQGYRICPVCEAGCGLRIDHDGEQILHIEANGDDVFSAGHVCPKGIALSELHADPDRLKTPLIRQNGTLQPASWEHALDLIQEQLNAIRAEHGPDAVALYIGNPTAHNVGLSLGIGPLAGILGSRQVFSAGTVDQVPKQLACELMFGDDMAVPVPDIERADCLLMLGANPVVSNGSLWMVPRIRERIRNFRKRGGRLITVDPRRTETARLADQHVFVRPGTDACLLAALALWLHAGGHRPRSDLRAHGLERLIAALSQHSMEDLLAQAGVSADALESVGAALVAAERPVVYGRIGTTLQAFGTLTSFLIEVVNIQLGALDAEGGAMFPEQAFAQPARGPKEGLQWNRFQSRVSALPEVLGQTPLAALAEEIETPGPGQIRALISIAGNPVLSGPDSARMAAALESLDFMVAIDIYASESARYADVILPGTSPFEETHYDNFLGSMGYRNTARVSTPLMPGPAERGEDEWTLMLRMSASIAHSRAATVEDARALEDDVIAAAAQGYLDAGQAPQEDLQSLLGKIGPERGVERLLDLGIRFGPWGDGFGQREGITFNTLQETPNGLDYGLPRPRLEEVVRHRDGKVHLAPDVILQEIDRLRASGTRDNLLLIGRRNIKSNNTWLFNLPKLNRGADLAVLEMHTADANARGIKHGDEVTLRAVDHHAQELRVAVATSEDLAPGVVCLPHGIARANYNALANCNAMDRPSGTAALNGIEVEVMKPGS